jgi:hypothetical protein
VAWMMPNSAGPVGVTEVRRTATRVTLGEFCMSNPSHFLLMLYSDEVDPVALPARPRQAVDEAGGDRLVDGGRPPMGKLVFQATGAFAEFERSIIRQLVRRVQTCCCSGPAWTAQGRHNPGVQGAEATQEGRWHPEGRQDPWLGTGTVQRIKQVMETARLRSGIPCADAATQHNQCITNIPQAD